MPVSVTDTPGKRRALLVDDVPVDVAGELLRGSRAGRARARPREPPPTPRLARDSVVGARSSCESSLRSPRGGAPERRATRVPRQLFVATRRRRTSRARPRTTSAAPGPRAARPSAPRDRVQKRGRAAVARESGGRTFIRGRNAPRRGTEAPAERMRPIMPHTAKPAAPENWTAFGAPAARKSVASGHGRAAARTFFRRYRGGSGSLRSMRRAKTASSEIGPAP